MMPSRAIAEADLAPGVTVAAPWRVKALTVLPGYRFAVTFQDGTNGIVDLAALASDHDLRIFNALRDPVNFAQASLELGVVT